LSIITKQNTSAHYRVTFSDGPITLIPPLAFTDLEALLTIDLEGYKRNKDFKYNLTYNNNMKSIEVAMEIITTIKDTFIIARVSDKGKISTTCGKPLQNSGSSKVFFAHEIDSEKISNFLKKL
jgi:hypothetical protein